MKSRERLLKCIKHELIDRVPISTYELVGWNNEAWENKEPSYKKLMDTIREYTDCVYMVFDNIKAQEELGDKGLMLLTIDDPVCQVAEMFEMGDFLVHAMTESGEIKYFLDAVHERQMYNLKNILENNVKDVIFRICGPEYVTPPYLSPEYFNNFVTCYLKEICREIKHADGITRIHSHGKIGKVIDQFAMIDADAIDPIEPIPDGDMELADVKRSYGQKFCLFGNIEIKELENAERKRIDHLIKKAMDDAKEGSGFILMPTAAPINVPLSAKTEENYLQMIESALRYGFY